MLSNVIENHAEEDTPIKDKQITITRLNIDFNNKNCKLLTFTDITVFKRLKLQEEKSKLLSTLNEAIHHEMLTPLNINVESAQRLLQKVETEELHEFAQMICVNSKLVRFYANDLLDHRIL